MTKRIALPVITLFLLAACVDAPLLDQPGKVRHDDVLVPPLYTSSISEDGTSWDWNAFFWLVGEDVEGDRRHERALPFYWHEENPPFGESTLVFPVYYTSETPVDRTRWYSIFYGYNDTDEVRGDFALLGLMGRQYSRVRDFHRSYVIPLYDWRHEGQRNDITFLSALGLATVLRVQTGLPAEGETVGALGRTSSRRIEALDVLGLITLFGYDDVGDRREIRFGTLFSSEQLSLFRSWRSRAPEDPFVSEWFFPVYMNRYDESGGFHYVGPLWGGWSDAAEQRETDWWALGLVGRRQLPTETTWYVCGFPVATTD